MCAPERIYYEYAVGQFLLCIAGNIQTFSDYPTLKSYVAGIYPDAELVEVDDDNWDQLYESGAFDL